MESFFFLIKSIFDWSNFKETHFAQNVTVTQKDKSTIFKSSVHCAVLVPRSIDGISKKNGQMGGVGFLVYK